MAGDLPKGLFRVSRSKNIYFKIKRWDAKKSAYVWEMQSSQTDDVPTALKVKAEAQALADQLAAVRGDDTASAHKLALEVVNRLLVWYDFPAITVPKWSAVCRAWLAEQESLIRQEGDTRPGIDPMKNFKVYKSRVSLFDKWLAGVDPDIDSITRADCQAFYLDAIDTGYQPSSVKAAIKVLKRIFYQAKDDGHIKANPWERLKTSGNNYRQKEPFTLSDIEKIRRGIRKLKHADEWEVAILFGLTLGARIKDCTIRSWEEIHLEEPAHIVYSPGKTKKRKNRNKHDVRAPLVNPLLSHLMDIAGEQGGFITPNLAELPTETLSNIFSEMLRDMKIPMRKEEGLKTWYSKGFHSWRHTLPSLLAKDGIDPEIRMAIVGHSDKETHFQYTHSEDSRLREPLEKALAKFGSGLL